MSSPSAWSTRPSSPTFGGGDWSGRPRYAPADFATLLWRERGLMLMVFLGVLVLGLAFAVTLKTNYTAETSVLVRLGQEYVYEPRIGDAGKGLAPQNDQVIQTEVEILKSDRLRRQVIDRIGYGRIFPKLADKYASATAARQQDMVAKGVVALGTGLKVESAPATTVIHVTFQHPNARMSALILNTLIQEYLVYRKQVLLNDAGAPVTVTQQRVFEDKLGQADAALQDFLAQNNIGDFEAQRTSLNTLQTSLTDESYRVQARLQEIGGRLGELGRQANAVPAEIGLYHDNNAAAADKLLTLKLQREDLLSRYKPAAQPVRDLDLQIAQVQKMIADGRAQSPGASRTGLNPVFQSMQTEQIQLNAEAASLRGRQAALQSQLAQVSSDRMKLAGLEPRYQDLLRDRDILSTNVHDLTAKVETDAAAKAIAEGSNDTIRVVEAATAPSKGASLKKPVAILAVLFALFSALCIGLLRVFLRPGVPTPSSAARTFDLPVLATAGLKTARR
jgi:uncharacterized protein involved in exopolysaccharide biosynthesis